MQNMILEFENVSFAYENSKALFEGVSIAFKKGCLYLIKGPSGCGKSTFLRLEKDLVIGTVRTFIQLFLLGFALKSR